MKRITFKSRRVGESLIITLPRQSPYLRLVLIGKNADRFTARFGDHGKLPLSYSLALNVNVI